MQRPSIPPPVETRRDLDVVERCRDVGDDPEDQEQAHPGLPNDHGHVFACEAESDHADEVEHPVHGECAVAVSDGVS